MATIMSDCCGHPDEEHHLTNMCQDVIHYPSEDYPCLCIGFENGAEGGCRNCQHRRESHVWARVCKPGGGDFCGCSRVVSAMRERS